MKMHKAVKWISPRSRKG